ncbi:MAG: cupin domain-containing protein [Vicinamibacterales bacterium]
MQTSFKPVSRLALATFIFGAGSILWVVGQGPAAVAAAAQQQAQSYFMGGNPSRVETKMTVASLKFPKGSRSNWHSHGTGQLLMVQEGRALTQERGGPVHEMTANQSWWTAPNVEHWHGAAQDVDLVQLTIYDGAVKWLEPVTDAQYKVAPKK